jgi:hypothetical protein
MPGPTTKDTAAIALGLMDVRVGPSAANIGTATPVLTSAHSIGALADSTFTASTTFYEHYSGFPQNKDLILPTQGDQMITCSFEEITPKNLAIAQGLDPAAASASWVGEGYKVVSSASGTYNASDDIDGGADAEADTYRVIFLTSSTYSVYSDSRGKLTGDQIGEGDTGFLSTFTDGSTELVAIPSGFFTGTWAADDIFTFYMAKQGYDSNTTGEIALGNLSAPAYVRVEGLLSYPDASRSLYVIFPRAQVKTESEELSFATDSPASVSITFEATRADSGVTGGNVVWDSSPTGKLLWVAA